jgi:NADP-dependent 3-hydroxy acid dehydrogenase YdfG
MTQYAWTKKCIESEARSRASIAILHRCAGLKKGARPSQQNRDEVDALADVVIAGQANVLANNERHAEMLAKKKEGSR